MRLSWKDGVATALTAAIVTLYAGYVAGAGWPLVSGPRVIAGVVVVAGLATCALGSAVDAGTATLRHAFTHPAPLVHR